MADFRPRLSARRVHDHLRRSLDELAHAEQNAVLWFADMLHRKLYRDLGYGSIHQYAVQELSFSPSRTSQFLRLSEGLRRLPQLEKAMARGEIPWTKAREIEKVATAQTERSWIATARRISRRELEHSVRQARLRAKAARAANPAQMALAPASSAKATTDTDAAMKTPAAKTHAAAATEVPGELRVVLEPEQLARYEALMAALRRLGHRAPRADLLLAGLEALVQEGSPRSGSGHRARGERRAQQDETHRDFTRVKSPRAEAGAPHRKDVDAHASPTDAAEGDPAPDDRRGTDASRAHSSKDDPPLNDHRGTDAARAGSRSRYQVLVHQCPQCEQGIVRTARGDRQVSPAVLAAILCDADIREPGQRLRARVTPRLRRRILTRDGYRCRSAGCTSTHFLDVHHRVKNGCNDPSNLITLCDACHVAVHRLELLRRRGRASSATP